jgi:AraC family transcriptional regulator of adaptative response/methylated-DNA-[protein]-cysteine methyltransferase
MTPAQYRRGGAGETIHYAVADTDLGLLLVAATERGICCVEFGADRTALVRSLLRRFPKAKLIAGEAGIDNAVERLAAAVQGAEGSLADLPLDIRGTVFQCRVWQELRRIPAGTTAPYASVAAAIGQPAAVRAVASACAANPVAVVVPCHRVVRTDGGLGGYRWGTERKAVLLEREGALTKDPA